MSLERIDRRRYEKSRNPNEKVDSTTVLIKRIFDLEVMLNRLIDDYKEYKRTHP